MPGRKYIRGFTTVSIACVTLLFTATISSAAPGDPDSTFNDDGIQNTDLNGSDEGADTIVLPNDKIVVVGETEDTDEDGDSDFGLVRYRTNGTLDPNFSGNGKQTTDFGGREEATWLVRQPNGKLVVVGDRENNSATNEDIVLARYKSDGKLDKTFSGDGKVRTDLGGDEFSGSVALLASGKIIVGGYREVDGETDFLVLRYNSNGRLDTDSDSNPNSHFRKKGWRTIDFSQAGDDDFAEPLVVRNGMITIGGFTEVNDNFQTRDFAFARLSTNGAMDTSFGEVGRAVVDFEGFSDNANDLKVLGNGKTIAVGQTTTLDDFAYYGFARLNEDGTPDDTFAGDGEQTVLLNGTEEGRGFALEVQSGKYISAGQDLDEGRFAVVRVDSSGEPDDTWGGDGDVQTDVLTNSRARGSDIDSEGRLVAAGVADDAIQDDFAVVRYLP
jgi:uncharacterized delta-60 repeat protein